MTAIWDIKVPHLTDISEVLIAFMIVMMTHLHDVQTSEVGVKVAPVKVGP
jgi:hypothetical protein